MNVITGSSSGAVGQLNVQSTSAVTFHESGKHRSKEEPPRGPIWGNQKPTKNTKKDADSSVDKMASAFTHMAHTVVSAINPSVKEILPTNVPIYLIQK